MFNLLFRSSLILFFSVFIDYIYKASRERSESLCSCHAKDDLMEKLIYLLFYC